jgi:multisubunit Na+/H+ antiporter MnhF subunit
VSIATEFKGLSRPEQLSIVFYTISGLCLVLMLPFSSFAPHLALIGVFSLITGTIVLMKRKWATWFVGVQFITAMAFSLWTIFAVGTGNWAATASLSVYAVLNVVATLYLTIWCKTDNF